MPARFILHIILTLILLAIGWWLFVGMGEGGYDSIHVATYWFTALVFILFSWLFYWFVHRLKTKAWIIALIAAGIIAAIATGSLLLVSKQNQQQLEDSSMEQDEAEVTDAQDEEDSTEIETLNLGEE